MPSWQFAQEHHLPVCCPINVQNQKLANGSFRAQKIHSWEGWERSKCISANLLLGVRFLLFFRERVFDKSFLVYLGNLFYLLKKSVLVFWEIFGGRELRGRLWVASAHADSRALWQSTSVSFVNHFQILYFVLCVCICVF